MITESTIGNHDAPIKCTEFSPDVNALITGSWDGTIKLWDPRAPACTGSYNNNEKVTQFTIIVNFSA